MHNKLKTSEFADELSKDHVRQFTTYTASFIPLVLLQIFLFLEQFAISKLYVDWIYSITTSRY